MTASDTGALLPVTQADRDKLLLDLRQVYADWRADGGESGPTFFQGLMGELIGRAIKVMSAIPTEAEVLAQLKETHRTGRIVGALIGDPDVPVSFADEVKGNAARSKPRAQGAGDDALRETLAAARASLLSEVVHMEQDFPSETPVDCGWWCRLCKDHVDGNRRTGPSPYGHIATCPIGKLTAVLARPLPELQAGDGWRVKGQEEGFAAAVAWLRERSAMKPPVTLHHAASVLADQLEQSRLGAAASPGPPATTAGEE